MDEENLNSIIIIQPTPKDGFNYTRVLVLEKRFKPFFLKIPSDPVEDMLHVHHRGTLTKAQKHFILLPLQVELVHFQKGFKFLPVNVV